MIVSNLTEHLEVFLGEDGEPFANNEKIIAYGWNYPPNGNQNPSGYFLYVPTLGVGTMTSKEI